MLVKICGIRTIKDARLTCFAGADIVGVLVGQKHFAKDFISKEKAKNITSFCKENGVHCSLVTHIDNAEDVIMLAQFIGNDFLQLHSNIAESEVEKIRKALPNVKIFRLLHVTKNGELLTDYKSMKTVDYFLIDSINLDTDQVGGTGIASNWKNVALVIEKLPKPTFLAGGLTPENVATAIKLARPCGVDVNSGCKNSTGKKDGEKIKNFVKNAKNA